MVKMRLIGIMFGVFFLVMAVMAYSVVETGVTQLFPSENGEIIDRFGVRYDEHIIVRRPFAQPAGVLAGFGVMILVASFLLKETNSSSPELAA